MPLDSVDRQNTGSVRDAAIGGDPMYSAGSRDIERKLLKSLTHFGASPPMEEFETPKSDAERVETPLSRKTSVAAGQTPSYRQSPQESVPSPGVRRSQHYNVSFAPSKTNSVPGPTHYSSLRPAQPPSTKATKTAQNSLLSSNHHHCWNSSVTQKSLLEHMTSP